MGKKGGGKVEVTQYYLSQHFGICLAEPDALLDVIVNEKSCLDATYNDAALVNINKPDLFGGIKKEGGLVGLMQYLTGKDTQFLPDVLAQKLGRANGADCPGYRGIASLFFYGRAKRGFYWSANAPFVPGVWAKVQRILKRADGSTQWYASKATIRTGEVVDSAETVIRLEMRGLPLVNPVLGGTVTTAGGFITAAEGVNGSRITPAELPTTTLSMFGVTYPSDRVDFYWRPPTGPILEPQEHKLQMQFIAFDLALGDVDFRLSIKAAGSDTFDRIVPKAVSAGIDPGTPSYSLAGPDGFFRAPYLGVWYFDTDGGATSGVGHDMNPAHIIHECLTDRDFGMGTPVSSIDDAAFRAAADTLHAEGFGLSMMWTRQSEIQKFISEVLDHIKAVLYTDPRTGLMVLKLIRDDYDPDTLPVLTPDNADLSSFGRKLWGDIVNEVIVTWTDPANEQETTVTVQDNASIAVQGGIISTSRNYYGVRKAWLAQRLAYRDLTHDGQPLASCEAVVDRAQFFLTPASTVKLTWPEYGITNLIMRVQEVDYGKPGDPEIKLTLVEDVFGLDIGSYDEAPATSWTDPSRQPSEMDPVLIFTLPYFFAVNSDAVPTGADPAYPEVAAGILATSDNEDGWEFDVVDEVTLASGGTEEQVIGTNNIIGSALLIAPLSREAETLAFEFGDIIGNTAPVLSGFVIIGEAEDEQELALIVADNGDDTYDLARGVLDTVPRAWPAGTRVWFVDEATVFEDTTPRSVAEVVDYRLLMRTSQGTLDVAAAELESGTMTERPYLPQRPANVAIDGEFFSSLGVPINRLGATTDLPVTWANRNRITEDAQVLRWTDATVTPEVDQTTTIEVRDLDGTLITAHTGLTGSSFDLPLASFGATELAEVRVFSERTDADGDFVSLQYWSEWVRVAGALRRTEDGAERTTEAGESRLLED